MQAEITRYVETHRRSRDLDASSIQALQIMAVQTAANWLAALKDNSQFHGGNLKDIQAQFDRAVLCQEALDGDLLSLMKLKLLGRAGKLLRTAHMLLEASE